MFSRRRSTSFLVLCFFGLVIGDLARAKTPPLTLEQAVAIALPKANAALDASYAQFRKKIPRSIHLPPAKLPWLTPDAKPKTSRETESGWEFEWNDYPPAGYSYGVELVVTHEKSVKIKKAEAYFATG